MAESESDSEEMASFLLQMMVLDQKFIFSCRGSLPDDMSVKYYKSSIDIAFYFILKQKLT
jgi:hypothetical protein